MGDIDIMAMLPFSPAQFDAVFAAYNVAIWPMQAFAYGLSTAALALVVWQRPRADALVAVILALLWAWTGIVYYWMFFAGLDPAAWAFGALFVLQALLLFDCGVLRGELEFRVRAGPKAWLGSVLIGYATVLYPLIGWLSGHHYPATPSFGDTPCPLTLFTLGVLLLSRKIPWTVLIVPLLWSAIGGSAAGLLGIYQDWALPLAAAAVLALRLMRKSLV